MFERVVIGPKTSPEGKRWLMFAGGEEEIIRKGGEHPFLKRGKELRKGAEY